MTHLSTSIAEIGTTSCSVCHAAAGDRCLGVDLLPLPFEHEERHATTPLFVEVLLAVAAPQAVAL